MPLEILSPILIALGAAIIVALERRFPYHRGPARLSRGRSLPQFVRPHLDPETISDLRLALIP